MKRHQIHLPGGRMQWVVDRGDFGAGELTDADGTPIDDAYVEEVVAEVRRKRGRPPLSAGGDRSKVVQVRFPVDLDDQVRRAAAAAGESRSEWIREAIRERLAKSG